MSYIKASIALLLVFTLLLGGVYPLLVTAVAQIIFHDKANGSLIMRDNKVIGSELLGQQFDEPKYFWGRPSATTPPYNAVFSSASNLNPANPKLQDVVKERVSALQKHNHKNKVPIPVDLVTASGSGVDPDISVEAAHYQISRVAAARRLTIEQVTSILEANIDEDILPSLPSVNVLKLNLALDEASGSRVQDSGKKK